MISITTAILLLNKIWPGPSGPNFRNFFIIYPMKILKDQNDVEFDFSISHALASFRFFMNNKQNNLRWTMYPFPTHPWNLYISINIVPNTLFPTNPMIIISVTFRNTSIPLKLYEITLFPKGSSAYYHIYPLRKRWVIIMMMTHQLQIGATGSIFIAETRNYQTLFKTPLRLRIKIKKRNAKIDQMTLISRPCPLKSHPSVTKYNE